MDLHLKEFGVKCTLEYMREHLRVLCGGDDLAFSTSCPWFTMEAYYTWAKARGVYVETDHEEPRDGMDLTFFSHRLYPRSVSYSDKKIVVAGGRLDKIVSSFCFLKKKDGIVNHLLNAQRCVGLMMNLWAYEKVYDFMEPLALKLVQQHFKESGSKLTPEWSGVFRSLPNEARMLSMWRPGKDEGSFFLPQLDWFKSKGVLTPSRCEYQSSLNRPTLGPMSNAAPLYIKRTTVPKFQQRKHGARGNRSGGAKLKLVGNAIVGGPSNSNKPRRRNARRNRGRGGRGAGLVEGLITQALADLSLREQASVLLPAVLELLSSRTSISRILRARLVLQLLNST